MDFDPTGAVLEDAPVETSGRVAIPFDAAGAVAEPTGPNVVIATHEDPVLQQQWAQSGPIDRIKMLAKHFWPSFKKENPVLTDPSKLATMGAPAAGATAGQILGAPFAEVGGVQIGGSIGGGVGDIVAQFRDMASGQQQGFKWGRLTGDVMTGAVPGASLAKAGAGPIIKQGFKYGASNLAAKTAETGIDEGRLPTLGEAGIAFGSGSIAAPVSVVFDKGGNLAAIEAKKMLYSIRDQTIKDAREAGYVIPGSLVNSKPGMKQGIISSAIESAGGKAATKQQMSIVNQEITNNEVKKDLGLPLDAPITPQSIRGVMDSANAPYEQVASLSPQAADDLNKLNQVREDKELLWSRVKARTGGIAERDQAIALDGEAEKLEAGLEQQARDAGKPELVDALRQARILKSKAYLAESALNAANGDIDPSVYGRVLDKKGAEYITGHAATIARMHQAFPDVMQTSPKAPNVSKLKNYASMALGAVGASHFGPAGIVAGAIPFSDSALRTAMISRMGQNSFLGAANYGRALPDAAAQLARFATQNAGRNPPQAINQFIQPQAQYNSP